MLAYKVPGFTYPIEDMDTDDREDYLGRLNKQLKAEADAVKRASKRKR